MAVRFDAAADRLSRITTGVLGYNTAYTVMFWAYLVSDLNAYGCLFSINSNDAVQNYDYVGVVSDGTTLSSAVDIGSAYTEANGTSLSVTTWYHIAIVRNSTTSLQIYLNGVSDSTNTRNISGRSSFNPRMEFGAFTTGNVDRINARIAAVKIWGAALTAAQVAQEIHHIRPVELDNFWAWLPLLDATDAGTDYSGNGRTFTATGLTAEANPPVSY